VKSKQSASGSSSWRPRRTVRAITGGVGKKREGLETRRLLRVLKQEQKLKGLKSLQSKSPGRNLLGLFSWVGLSRAENFNT